jgi:type II secretory pathway component PulF
VDQELQAGKSLQQALAAGDTRESRSLAACIDAGEATGQLDRTLEAWTAMHLANSVAARTLRAALAYPLLLIAITLLSLGYMIWSLIPEYKITYSMFGQSLPNWLDLLVRVREHYAWLIALLACLSLLPLVVWTVQRRRFDNFGLPREQARRLRLQATASELAGLMIDASRPLSEIVATIVKSTGANLDQVTTAFAKLQAREGIPPLARETTLLLATLHAGVMDRGEAAQHLHALAQLQNHQAAQTTARQARWLPMLVALAVGLVTILSYVFLIYLPWLLLLKQISLPAPFQL